MNKDSENNSTDAGSDEAAAMGGESREIHPVRNDSELLNAIADFIRRNPDVLGGEDIFMITGGRPTARAGMLAAILAGIVVEDGDRAIQNYMIIIPPEADVSSNAEFAWNGFKKGFAQLAGRSMTQKESTWFRARFELRNSPDGRVASLLALIQGQAERTAVIVVEAATYRDDKVTPLLPEGTGKPLAPEDVWVPQLHALARAAVAIAEDKNFYVALDANELTPVRQELEVLLLSIDRCGVMGASDDAGAESIVAKRGVAWDQWITAGYVGRALGDVDALPTVLDPQKPFLRIQLLHKAGLHVEALGAIRSEFLARDQIDQSTRVRLAKIAEDAGASSLARELLQNSVEELKSREDLEGALGILMSANEDVLADQVADRLELRFPGSEGVRRHRRVQQLRARDYAAVADLWREEDLDQAEFYDALSTAFSTKDVPDYLSFIHSAKDGSQAEAFRLAGVDDALARGLTVHAFQLAVSRPATPALLERWERRLLDVLERCFLDAGPDGNPPVDIPRMQDALRTLLGRLADNPLNVMLRVGLVELLRPNVAGTTGLVLIAKLVLEFASAPIKSQKGLLFDGADAEWLIKHKPFLERALGWLESEQPIVIGKLSLPRDLLTEDPDTAISALASYLEKAPVSDDTDIQALRLFLTTAAAIAPHASDPDIDLRLYRLVAGKIVSAGFPQHGRDLVEAAIQAGVSSPRRRRLSWFAIADVYHRSHDHLTGLVALGCTFLADRSADEEQVWQEIYTTARYLRDIGLSEIALETVGKGREHLARMDLLESHGHRLDLLEIQVRVSQIGPDNQTVLQTLLADMVRVGQAVLKQHDETAPSGIMLGQLIRTARTAGLEITDEAERVFAELSRWAGGNLQAMIEATSMAVPNVDQLARLTELIPAARYAEDVGYDMNVVANIAMRILTDDEVLARPEDVSFILEVGTDWGTALPNWDERAAPPPVPGKTEPAAIARALSAYQVAILQLGLDADGLLVRAECLGGLNRPATREPVELFSRQALYDWSREFPRRYGHDDSPNLFYTTIERLQLSAAPELPTIVLATTELQSFPPNILFDGREFLGRRQPVATAPSLAWLKGSVERNWTGDGRMVAWISNAESESGRATLSLLSQRLEAPFAEYGFAVNTSAAIPATFSGATMTVLTAHGGVHPEGKYFQAISDEGVLIVSAADLAAAVRNVGVVVLFVCSGGRADKHPGANTTLGLAKQILDRGCSAVIASPWPLDSQVPPHWLPGFLESWKHGATLMEAVYAANKIVDTRFALDPACGLAMTVYGNPLLKQS